MQDDFDIKTTPYRNGLCWICGQPADSSEHRLKKTDLVSKYGEGAFIGDNKVVHVVGGQLNEIQGPGSRRLKYQDSLCKNCNNSVTQQHDRAYERLQAWIAANEVSILSARVIDFCAVFGANYPTEVANLIRYYAKSLGCKINDAKRPVPVALSDAARGGVLSPSLQISFCVQEDLARNRDVFEKYIGKADLYGNQEPDAHPFYSWSEEVSWFTTMISYRYDHDPRWGTVLSDTVEVAHLGSLSAFTIEERVEFDKQFDRIRERPE